MITLFIAIYLATLFICLFITLNAGVVKSKYIVLELSKVDISNDEKKRIAREIIADVYPEYLGKKALWAIAGILAERQYTHFKQKKNNRSDL